MFVALFSGNKCKVLHLTVTLFIQHDTIYNMRVSTNPTGLMTIKFLVLEYVDTLMTERVEKCYTGQYEEVKGNAMTLMD